MAVSAATRYHESGHALAAYRLGMLHERGMILNSDQDAYVCVAENGDGTRCWIVKRIAIKLAGPLGRMRQQDQRFHWDTLKYSEEYWRDFQEGKDIACQFLGLNLLVGESLE